MKSYNLITVCWDSRAYDRPANFVFHPDKARNLRGLAFLGNWRSVSVSIDGRRRKAVAARRAPLDLPERRRRSRVRVELLN